LRFLFITTSYPRWDGDFAGIFIHRVAKVLVNHDHRVKVAAPHSEALRCRDRLDGVDVYRFRYLPPLLEAKYGSWYAHEQTTSSHKRLFLQARLSLCLFALLSRGYSTCIRLASSSDVIMSHWAFPSGLIGEMVSRQTGLPHILKVYGGDLSVVGRNPLLRIILKQVLESADQLVSNSNVTSSKAQKICGRNVIPVFEGVDVDTFKPSVDPSMIKEKYGGSPLLFSVGRFIPYKGFEYIVKIMPRLKRVFPNIKLVIGGTGPLHESIQQLVQDLKLSDCVHLPGFIPNKLLPLFYAACDVYVAPSIIDERGNTEGLNITVLEAMSTGKPVVASRVGGLVDAVKHGETGILVPEKNPLKLSEAITRLLLDEELATTMGRQGRQRILEFFTIDKTAERVIRICEATLRRKLRCGERIQ